MNMYKELTDIICRRLTVVWITTGFTLMWPDAAFAAQYLYFPEPVPFYIERPVTRALFSLELTDESNKGRHVDTEKDTETTVQKLDIRTRGWAYHPALVVFDLGLRPEFRQASEDGSPGATNDEDANFLGYFLDTTWLKDKPYTLNLFTSKDKSEVTSTLAADTTTTTTVNRGRLLLKYPVLPTTFTLESREAETEAFYRTLDKNDSFRIESRKETENSNTTLDVESRTQEREILGNRSSTDRDTIFLRNNYNISDKSHLSSGLSYSDSDSDVRDTRIARVSSRLRVRHRKNFSTHYSGRYEDRQERDFTSKNTTLSAGLTHLLYENLTTSFNLTGTKVTSQTGISIPKEQVSTSSIGVAYPGAGYA